MFLVDKEKNELAAVVFDSELPENVCVSTCFNAYSPSPYRYLVPVSYVFQLVRVLLDTLPRVDRVLIFVMPTGTLGSIKRLIKPRAL